MEILGWDYTHNPSLERITILPIGGYLHTFTFCRG